MIHWEISVSGVSVVWKARKDPSGPESAEVKQEDSRGALYGERKRPTSSTSMFSISHGQHPPQGFVRTAVWEGELLRWMEGRAERVGERERSWICCLLKEEWREKMSTNVAERENGSSCRGERLTW